MGAQQPGSVARPKRRSGECVNIVYREERGKIYLEIDLSDPEYVTRIQRRLMLASTHGPLLINPEVEVVVNVMSQRRGFDRVDFDAARSAWHEIMTEMYGTREVG